MIFVFTNCQVYQTETELYVKKDKYWGRELDEAGLRGALRHFFHNGIRLRNQVVSRILALLDELRRAIERQSSYRFFSW